MLGRADCLPQVLFATLGKLSGEIGPSPLCPAVYSSEALRLMCHLQTVTQTVIQPGAFNSHVEFALFIQLFKKYSLLILSRVLLLVR